MQTLPTLGSRGDQAALQICEALAAASSGDLFSFAEIFQTDEGTYCGSLEAVGDDTAVRLWTRYAHGPLDIPWDPEHAPEKARNQFRDGEPPDDEEQFVWRTLYAPLGLEHVRRILFYDQDRCVGWLGAHRMADAPPYTADEQARMVQLTDRLSVLARARARLEGGPPADGANIVLSESGRVLGACEAGEAWLTVERRRQLAMLLRAVLTHRRPATGALIGAASVRLVRLEGAAGSTYLCMLSPARRPRLSPLASLTRAQREVAELAVVGATAPEIAKHLGRSVETVRAHLKSVYRRLGIASRLELAALLGGTSPSI